MIQRNVIPTFLLCALYCTTMDLNIYHNSRRSWSWEVLVISVRCALIICSSLSSSMIIVEKGLGACKPSTLIPSVSASGRGRLVDLPVFALIDLLRLIHCCETTRPGLMNHTLFGGLGGRRRGWTAAPATSLLSPGNVWVFSGR